MCDIVKEIDIEEWKSLLMLYNEAITAKAQKMRPDKKKDLLELDEWYQNDLPTKIEDRKERYITHDELCRLMKWKLTRGKFRPRLTELVKENSPDLVESASREAFKKLPDLSGAIKELIVLKAVGPATASAVIAAGAPGDAGFMADESMIAIGGLQPIKYDLSFYMSYMNKVKAVVKELNKNDTKKSWTPHKVELTLWTYQILSTIDPGKLKRVNGQNNSDGSPPLKKKKKT